MVCKKCNFCLLFFSFSRSGATAVQFLAAKDNFLCLSSEKRNHFLWFCSAEAGLYSSLQFSSRLVCWERRRRKKFSWAMFLFEFLCCYCRQKSLTCLLFLHLLFFFASIHGQEERFSRNLHFSPPDILNSTSRQVFLVILPHNLYFIGSAGSKKWLWIYCRWYWSSR